MRSFSYIIIFFTFIPSLYAQRSDFNEINFQKAETIANRYKGEELYNLPVLTFKLTSQLDTDVERFRAIYYWISHNISGDFDLMSKNERKRKKLKNDPEGLGQWNNHFKKEVFNKLLHKKKTLCTGYAYLLKELSNLAGIESEIIYGYGTTRIIKSDFQNMPNHSWNVVKLNGKWYLCDATWSSGFTDMSTFLFEFNFDNAFFLMEPTEFVKSHRPIEEKWTLLLQSSELNNSE